MTADGAVMTISDLARLTEDATVYAVWKEVYHYSAGAYDLLGTYGEYENVWSPTSNFQMLGAKTGYDAFLYINFKAGDTVKLWKDGQWLEWEGDVMFFAKDKDGNAKISFDGKYSVYVEKGKAFIMGEFVNAGEGTLENTWSYWYVQDEAWECGDVVTMTNVDKNGDMMQFTYAGGSTNWCTQIFYTDSSFARGSQYTLTCYIYASAAVKATINGEGYALKEGNNEIEVFFTVGDIAAFDAQFSATVDPVSITISKVTWKAYEAPANEMPYGDEKTALKNAGTYYYWARDWSTPVVVSVHTYEDGVITVTYTGAGENWWDVQLFCANGDLIAGKAYKLSMKINASAACTITVKGQVFALSEGDNEISVNFWEDKTYASFSVQFGVDEGNAAVAAGTFTFSDIAFGSTFTGDADKYYLIGKFGETEVWNNVNTAYVFGAGDDNNTATLMPERSRRVPQNLP